MSTFSHPLQPAPVRRLSLVPKNPCRPDAGTQMEEQIVIEDDGLGCMRGVAAAMVCILIFVLMIAAAWGLWRLLR